MHVIGDVSHDIKNLLTPIQSGVWTLEPMLADMFEAVESKCHEQPPAPDLGQQVRAAMANPRDEYGWILGACLEAVERVQARTKEIADAVKGESAPPRFTPADLNEIASRVLRPLQLIAAGGGVALNLDLDPALPLVDCDRQQVYNALYNLVNNAIPETPAGGSVTIRTVSRRRKLACAGSRCGYRSRHAGGGAGAALHRRSDLNQGGRHRPRHPHRS